MFRQTYQLGLLSILSSQGSKPFETWTCKVSNGHIKRITDEDTNSLVLELISSNVSSTYVTCPCSPYDSLGIKMQYLNLYIKNLRRYFVMEIEVLDSQKMHRRFKISTFATKTKIGPFGTHSPLNWVEGWNRLTLNLESFTKTVYGSNYVECRRITIHANCRIRRVFFADREYKEEDLPLDYQIRCRIDRPRRYAPARRLFASRKPTYESKTNLNQAAKVPTKPTKVPSQVLDSVKQEVEEQSVAMQEIPSDERMINAPQGSVASDIQQAEDLSDNDQISVTEQIDNQQPIVDQIDRIQLDADDANEKSFDDMNLSSNAWRQRFLERFHR